jgi:hypothetical protein
MALDSQDTSGGQSFTNDFPLGLDMNFNFTSVPETQVWSPIVVTIEDDSLFTIPFEGSAQSNPWSPTVCPQRGFLRSSASSLTESCPLLSPPGHQSLTSSIDRSSYGSSLRTWDTASTLASVYDPCLEDPIIEDFETETAQTINPIKLTKGKPLPTSRFSISQTIPEEASPFPEHMITYPKDRGDAKTGPPVPPKPSKSQGVYYCTVCQTQINRKWDWERHGRLIFILIC